MFGLSTITNLVVIVALIPNAFGSSLRRLEAEIFQVAMDGTPLPYCFVENGVDYPGNDIGNVPGQATECCDKCTANANCKAWTWDNSNNGTCFLKSQKSQGVNKEGVTSAQVFQDSQCNIKANTNFVGNDLRKLPGKNPQECCDMCRIRDLCQAYVWSNDNGGTCFLKRQRGTGTPAPGMYAGTY